jgi:hypothetical protein
MTDTTAAFDDVPSFFDGFVFPFGDLRRIVRAIGDGVVIGFGTVAASCVLAGTVTVAAAWIISVTLAVNPNTHMRATTGPGTFALANHHSTLANVATVSRAMPRLAARAEARDVTFEDRWAGMTVPGSARNRTVSIVPQHPVERADNIASLPAQPLQDPHRPANPEISKAPDSKQMAELTPAPAPPIVRAATPALSPKITPERANRVPLPRPNPAKHEIAHAPVAEPAPKVAAVSPPPAPKLEKRAAPQQVHNKAIALPAPDSRTAVYDIAAHTVYLPNGEKLEAHSGLYDKLDDPRYVKVKMRGPTPPNVYDLTLREQLFHGVRAIRLNPVDESKMFGRDGMLAHTYMLGPNGQSNGCVSFKDYRKFLQAYLDGEVNRLVVVPSLGGRSLRTARARIGHADRYASNYQTDAPGVISW